MYYFPHYQCCIFSILFSIVFTRIIRKKWRNWSNVLLLFNQLVICQSDNLLNLMERAYTLRFQYSSFLLAAFVYFLPEFYFLYFFLTKGIKSVRKYAIFMLPFALNYAQCRQSGETERERERERERKRARCTCGQGLHCPLINVTLIMWPRVCWLHFTVTLHAVCPHSALGTRIARCGTHRTTTRTTANESNHS